jgi:asparagine synthase (glutamine-hydrolysing)
MCGISGFTGPDMPGLLGRMLDSIRHRGPDEDGTYRGENVSLGMVRLSIIDVAGGHQPMANSDGSIVVVFNGEIYNYVELRQELEAKGYVFRTASDTETLVHGYQEYGISFLHKLNGMFAIALWDARKKSLFVIRDRLGVKPLFYALHGKDVCFGSEIKAVLHHPRVSRQVKHEAVSQYLSLRYVPPPNTIYKDVRSLPPGHLLIWSPLGTKIERWYQLPMQTRYGDDDEERLVTELDDLLRESVKLRMRSDVQFGAYLSGGIDSSMVVAIMSEFSPQPIKTFSLAFADTPAHKQDAHFARMVADRYRTDHHEFKMAWTDLRDELPAVLAHLDQPFAGVISSYWLTRYMRKHVTVALSGDGADDAFGSYGHHRLVWPIQAAQAALREGANLDDGALGFFRGRGEFVERLARMDPWDWRLFYAGFPEDEKAELLSPMAPPECRRRAGADYLRLKYQETGPEVDPLNRMLYLDLMTLLPNEVLYYADILSMAHGLEARSPFLDYRIVELACSIPGSLKIKGTTLKYILRQVAARYLPKAILERPKEGFVLPNNTWLREGLAPFVRAYLSAPHLNNHGFFNQAYVDSLTHRFLAGDESLTFRVWSLLVFQIWYEQHCLGLQTSVPRAA